MSPEAQRTLLVPMKVQALAVDEAQVRNGLRGWSPRGGDLAATTNGLAPYGPLPFFGATPGEGEDSSRMHPDPAYMPGPADAGVHLHWVLPPGLRHAHAQHQHVQADGAEGVFPRLPDQWLVLRFDRNAAGKFSGQPDPARCRAWLVDASLALDEETRNPDSSALPTCVVAAGGGRQPPSLRAQPVGRAVPVDAAAVRDFAQDPPGTRRVRITALGTNETGSPYFTAFVPDNRHLLSFHDDLSDLRSAGEVPEGTVLSYLVVGWYHKANAGNGLGPEVLEHLQNLLRPVDGTPGDDRAEGALQAVLRELDWLCEARQGDADSTADAEVGDDDARHWTCIFHGMVAQLNYFDGARYHGRTLGAPDAPTRAGTSRSVRPAFQVGIGNNTTDALVALVADRSDDSSLPMWQALEAVVYHQSASLLQGWRENPRQRAVHQAWFHPQHGGLRWTIVASDQSAAGLAGAEGRTPVQSADERTPAPSAQALAVLATLNDQQSQLNHCAQGLAALEQDLYAAWWRLAQTYLQQGGLDETNDGAGVDQLINRGADWQRQLPVLLAAADKTSAQLRHILGDQLELHQEAAPRFWAPADPAIVIHNAGQLDKHAFPSPLRCRTAVRTRSVTASVDDAARSFSGAHDSVIDLSQVIEPLPVSAPLIALIHEAAQLEQATFDLASRSAQQLDSEADWQRWVAAQRAVLAAAVGHAADPLAAGADAIAVSGNTPESPPSATAPLAEPTAAEETKHGPARRATLRLSLDDGHQGPLSSAVALWGEQPWSPLYLDWQITWFPDACEPDAVDFGAGWAFDAERNDYAPAPSANPVGRDQGIPLRGRSLMAPQMGAAFTDPIAHLEQALTGEATADVDPRVAAVLRSHLMQWQRPLQDLAQGGLLGQTLSGFHQMLLGRDVLLPRIRPSPAAPWVPAPATAANASNEGMGGATDAFKDDGSPGYNDARILASDLMRPPVVASASTSAAGEQHLRLTALAPPATGERPLPFGLLRGGSFRVDALWMVDDFGQWWDLLNDPQCDGIVVSPHLRASAQPERIIQPPRVLQPARLNFRFVSSDFSDDGGAHPRHNPICGWVFYNHLDRALALCNADGQLLGELVSVQGAAAATVRWECLAQGQATDTALDELDMDPTLRAFAQSLLSTSGNQALRTLLGDIDTALGHIRPAAGHTRLRLAGRPLALVNARIGLELFGQAWRDPQGDQAVDADSASADPVLDRLRLPVRLGHAPLVEEGLVGYFKRGGKADMQRLVPVVPPANAKRVDSDAVKVGFGHAQAGRHSAWQDLTLLMDPHAAVHAEVGVLPGKSLRLPKVFIDRALSELDMSFRVAPLIVRQCPSSASPTAADGPLKWPVPLPPGWQGRWGFEGPQAQAPREVSPPDAAPDHGPAQRRAIEGRLVLRRQPAVADPGKAPQPHADGPSTVAIQGNRT
jgi:hypothetical protein